MKKIGLYFGTFNPIHVGHLIIANYMADHANLSEVWMVVSPQNPMKQRSSLLADIHRLQLVRIAVEDNPRLKASNIEFDLPKPSYTVHTLAYLREKYPDTDFVLIMGEDNLRSLPKWKNYEQIIKEHEILVYPRLYTEDEEENQETGEFSPKLTEAKYRMMNAPVMRISASFIRQSIREGHDVRYLLTEPVERYVREMHFYEKG
jgi:nicotinate-nucleotide adenylyltransferase